MSSPVFYTTSPYSLCQNFIQDQQTNNCRRGICNTNGVESLISLLLTTYINITGLYLYTIPIALLLTVVVSSQLSLLVILVFSLFSLQHYNITLFKEVKYNLMKYAVNR